MPAHHRIIPMQESPQATRASLLLRLRDAHNAEAWEQFVTIYTPIIFGFCRSRSLQEADAADVSQEVMRTVARAMEKFEYDPARGRFRNWLLTVTRSKLSNFFSSQQRRPEPEGDTSLLARADAEPTLQEQQSWDTEYHGRLFEWAAEQLRPTMQEATWQAFWRTTINEEDPAKVADELKLNVGSVYAAKSRVLVRLKEKIQSVDEEADTTFRAKDS